MAEFQMGNRQILGIVILRSTSIAVAENQYEYLATLDVGQATLEKWFAVGGIALNRLMPRIY